MDMRHCDKDELYHLQYVLMLGDKATFLDYCEQRGIDFMKYPMEVELSEIELSGMILTRDNFESTIKGLFNGCVFYSLSGAMCGGYRAAIKAAGLSYQIEDLPFISPEEVRDEMTRIFGPMETIDGMDYKRFELAIRQVMTYYMGYVRNEKGMETALERLHHIEGYIDDLQASTFRELMRVNEAVHLLRACQLSTRATLERKESGRTIYRRSDYPDLDEAYSKVLAIWEERGEQRLSWL